MKWLRIPIVVALTWVLCAGFAAAAVPSPARSFVSPVVFVCPSGDSALFVAVRNINNNPVILSDVIVSFCDAPGAHLCPASGAEDYVIESGCAALNTTGADGVVVFHLRAGGTAAAGTIKVFADGLLLASRALVSPDQNGDLFVDAADAAIAAAKLGSSDPTADVDGDHTVTSADLAVLAAHGGHTCIGSPTGGNGSTWGRIKSIYR